MTGDKEKVMRFLVENMREDAELMTHENAAPPKDPVLIKTRAMYDRKDVTEQQMVCNFVRHCGIGRGAGWKGVIIMPTSVILTYMRDIVHDALYTHLQLGDVVMTQTANSTIVVKWHTGEELRLEACHCAIALQHLRGCRFQFMGFIHSGELSDRTMIVANRILESYNKDEAPVIYEA